MARQTGLRVVPDPEPSPRVSAAPVAVLGPSGRAAAAAIAAVARSPLDGYLNLYAQYGDTIRVPVGPRSVRFLLSRPEYAEHVLVTSQDNYIKPVTYRGLRALIGDGLLTSEGETWRQHRRLVQPVFSRRDVLAFGPPIMDAARRMLADWSGRPDGAEVDAAAQMSALALDVVGRALFGADLTGAADRMNRMVDAGQRVAVVAGLLALPRGPRSEQAIRALARRMGGGLPGGAGGFSGRLIAGRRAELARGGGEGRRRDVLDVLLTGGPGGAPLTDTEAGAEVTTFLLAGHETTANTLSWALGLLAAFPAARARLEDEVDTVLAGREPEAADAARLPWTTAVISETLRLYPPAWTVERSAVADDRVSGVRVPAGSVVSVPPFLIHRHPEFWPDPAGFEPDRFIEPDPGRPRYAYIPFGGGRRACVGQAFAELEAVLVLAAIGQRYRLQLTPAGLPKPSAGITLRPGRALPMRLSRR